MSKRDGSRLRQHRLSGFPIWLTSDLARAEGLTGGPGNVNFRTKFAFLQNRELEGVRAIPAIQPDLARERRIEGVEGVYKPSGLALTSVGVRVSANGTYRPPEWRKRERRRLRRNAQEFVIL